MTTKINDKSKIFITKLQVLYDMEKRLEKALPKILKAISDPELKEVFALHLEETRVHSKRLENMFVFMDSPIKKMTSEGMHGIITDLEWVIGLDMPTYLKDAMLASSARYMEHYEIAGYKTAIMEAEHLGSIDLTAMLRDTLKEEELVDEKLTQAIIKNLK